MSGAGNRSDLRIRRERAGEGSALITKGTSMRTIRGVLLDVDGTLIDSNDAHAHAWVKALAESGYDVPFHTV